MKCVEITEELFKSIITSDDACTEVVETKSYMDIFYSKHGVKFLVRSQNFYKNYYVCDINN